MAPAATVQTSAAARTCSDCHRPIESSRRYCDRDRDRRRALTFLRQAEAVLSPVNTIIPFPTARQATQSAIRCLEQELDR